MKSKEIMQEIRDHLNQKEPKVVAAYTGLSRSCIYALRNGKTKWPRGTTVDCVLDACGLKIMLVNTGKARV